MPYFIEKRQSEKELQTQKILVGEIKDTSGRDGIFTFIFKALLIFLAGYSTIAGLLSAFEIPFDKTVIFISFLIFSFIASFLYKRKIIFYAGYIILFLAFTIELSRYFFYANSGFQAVVNIIFEAYSDYFEISTLRQAQELYSNRYVTVTFAAIFVGLFLIILLNITISGYMNFLETFVITFPFLEIAFYIRKKPPLPYIVALLFVYFSVFLLQSSRYSRTQVKGKHTHEFARIKKKNNQFYFYQTNPRIFIISMCTAAVLSVSICLISSGVYYQENARKAQNSIHKQVDEYVKIYLQSGFTGFINSYSSTGGLSGGRLGGVTQVRPDFETDLTVTYAPANYETVYLKGFTGSSYVMNQWSDNAINYNESGNIENILPEYEISAVESMRSDLFENKGKMYIENSDANPQYVYRPYFTNIESDENKAAISEYKKTPYSVPYEIYYTPCVNTDDYLIPKEDALLKYDDYAYYVNQNCTYVPDNLKPVLDDTLSQIEFDESLTGNEYRLSAAEAVYDYFCENYSYTMSPGSTPRNKDFVDYFLTTQKRGYCAHFATSTVLLLREKGIPARYCEGYCIPLSLIYDEGVIKDYDYNEWYSGEQTFGREAVLSVEVNDSFAHAWIEIYLDGYGFVPFEATIPSFEDSNGNNNFNIADLFSGLLSNTLDIDANADTSDNNGVDELYNDLDIFKSIASFNVSSASTIAVIMISFIAAIILLILLIKWITIKVRLVIYKLRHDEYNLTVYEYNKLVRKLQKKKYIVKKNPLMSDVHEAYIKYLEDYNSSHKKQKDLNLDELFNQYERILYS